MSLAPGTRLGPYEVVAPLGAGGMGEVYRAQDLRLERQVALKVLRPEFVAEGDRLRRFEQEARAASALNHPNIVTIFDIGRHEGVAFYVMELVRGGSLRDRLTGRPLPAEITLDIVVQVADGLAKAHDAGIIHRDLKPENVLISDDGFAKIVDFGIAKLLQRPEHSLAATSSPGVTTAAGLILGTVGYMSPEQASGGEIGVRSDLFSLGTMIYEMLAGQAPFARATPVQTMSAIIEFAPVPLARCTRGVPLALSELVQQLLHKDPAERLDARPLAQELRGLRTRMPATPTPRLTAAASARAATGADTDRRHVTVIEAELADYGSLVDSIGSDAAEALHTRITRAFDACVTAHGGIAENRGERFVALFGLHAMAEDDAVQATRAACEFRDEARAEADRLGADRQYALPRLGIASGEVIVLDRDAASGGTRVTGEAAQVVSKMLDTAEGDEILVTSDTWRLVDGFAEGEAGPRVRLKGRSDTGTFRVTGQAAAQTRLDAEERRGLTAFAGRQEELGLLRTALAEAQAGTGRLVKVVGEPGVGKSRLLHEFRIGLPAGVRALRGRCLAHNTRSRYAPFLDPLRDLLLADTAEHGGVDTVLRRLQEIEPELVAYAAFYLDVLSLRSVEHEIPSDLKGDDLSLAFREALATLFTAASAGSPLALLLEDWHWADRASEELLHAVSGLAGAHPLLVVVTTRPEAPGSDAAWQNVITLPGVDVATTGVLAAAVLGGSQVGPGLTAFVHERSAGNPLFVEELCRTLREEGHVREEGGVVELRTGIGSAHLPDTIHAVLRSRLDRLEPRVRDMLRTASVVGREFSRGILTRVTDNPAALTRDLEVLKTARMIQQIRLVPDAVFRFHHALLHEVAYQSLLTYQRRVKHGAVAEAILAQWPGQVDDHGEDLARHFAAAEDWPRAARHGLTAAKRAMHQSRFADARDALDEVLAATARVPGDQVADVRLAALLEQERVCEIFGDRIGQRRLVDELLLITRQHPDRQHLAAVLLRQGDLNAFEGRHDLALTALGEALGIQYQVGDEEGARKVLRSLSFTCWQFGEFEQGVAHAEEALALSVRLADADGEATDRASVATLLRRQGRLDEALAQIQHAMSVVDAQPDPLRLGHVVYAAASHFRAVGLNDEAKNAFQRCFDLAKQARLPLRQAPPLMALAGLAAETGDFDESLRLYEQAAEIHRGLRHAHGLALVLSLTAEMMAAMGRHGDALSHALESARLFEKLEDRGNEAAAWRLAATTAEAMPAQAAQAEDAWRRLVALLGHGPNQSALSEGLLSLARLLRSRRAPDAEVLALYDQACQAAGHAGAKDVETKVWNARGILHWTAGRFEAAHDCYEHALVLARETGDTVHTAFLLNSLATTLKSLGRVDDARAQFAEALRISREAGGGQVESHALAGLGDLATEAGDAAEAAAYYRESLSLREVLGDRRGEGWMRARLAGVLATLGHHDEAHALRAIARAIAESENDDRLRKAVGE